MANIFFIVAFILGTLGNYLWKLDVYEKERNRSQVNIYTAFQNGVPKFGFACVCKKNSSGSTSWNGDLDKACDNQYPDKPIPINVSSYWIPAGKTKAVLPPSGACCKLKPKTASGVLPNVRDGTQCWKSH